MSVNSWTPQTDLTKIAGLTIHKASDMEDQGFCCILYGAPGMGKTTLIGQLSNTDVGGRVFIADADGGSYVLGADDSIDIVNVDKYEQIDSLIKAFSQMKEVPYQTIAFDVLSEIADKRLVQAAGGGQPQIQHYGEVMRDIVALVRSGRDLAKKRGVNVIFTAWEENEKDDTNGSIKKRINFTAGVQTKLIGIVDIIIRITMENDGTRILDMQASNKTDAKFRRAHTANQMAMPLKIPYKDGDSVFPDVIRTLKTDVPFPKEKYIKTKEK